MIKEANGMTIELQDNGTIYLSDQFGEVGINVEDYDALKKYGKKQNKDIIKNYLKKIRRKEKENFNYGGIVQSYRHQMEIVYAYWWL